MCEKQYVNGRLGLKHINMLSRIFIKHITISGMSQDGGYAEYMLVREEAAVPIPDDAVPAKVAPLLCAGVTVFNGMRHCQNVFPGEVCVVVASIT